MALRRRERLKRDDWRSKLIYSWEFVISAAFEAAQRAELFRLPEGTLRQVKADL